MGLLFSSDKRQKSSTRKLPFLPRIGIYVDFAGYEFVMKHVPLLETLFNINPYHLTRAKLEQVISAQLDEVIFPPKKKEVVVSALARTISVQTKKVRKKG